MIGFCHDARKAEKYSVPKPIQISLDRSGARLRIHKHEDILLTRRAWIPRQISGKWLQIDDEEHGLSAGGSLKTSDPL